MTITKFDAVLALVGNVSFGVTPEGEILWHEVISNKPTEEAINAKLAELKAEYDANEYQRQRAAEYPSWQDQLDKIYHDGVMSWQKEIKAIKDKYPKS
jgi:hypothetical protein